MKRIRQVPTVVGSPITEAVSSVLTITGGNAAGVQPMSIRVKQASAAQSGYLDSGDFAAFAQSFAGVDISNQVVPVSGGTENLQLGVNILEPAGALATLTVNMPAPVVNRDVCIINITKQVVALTVANGTIINGPTAVPVGGGVYRCIYNGTNWYLF